MEKVESLDLQKKEDASDREDVEEKENEYIEQLSFSSITKIGFIKLVQLNFTSISMFTLMMLNCVPVGGKLHLYLYGDAK